MVSKVKLLVMLACHIDGVVISTVNTALNFKNDVKEIGNGQEVVDVENTSDIKLMTLSKLIMEEIKR